MRVVSVSEIGEIAQKAIDAEPNSPFALAVIGGIGSGKSYIAENIKQAMSRNHSIPPPVVISADEIGHRILGQDAIQAELRRRWGTLTRREIAQIVFNNPIELAFLNSLLHPLIMEEVTAAVCGTSTCSVLDIPLLLEYNGALPLRPMLVFIDCRYEIRLERVKRRGWTEDELRRRESFQMPLEEKKRQADYVIVND